MQHKEKMWNKVNNWLEQYQSNLDDSVTKDVQET